MTQFPEFAIQGILAGQKRQNGIAAFLDSAARTCQSLIVTERLQSPVQRMKRALTQSCAGVYIGQIQMKLDLPSFPLNSLFAKLDGFRQISFSAQNRDTKKRQIVRVPLVAFERAPEKHDSLLGIRVLQHLDALGKCGDSVEFGNTCCTLGWH